ncbi:efflux RND transporter periplasmic adaptor subunit [Novosphingobium rosa]|uniref:efflux RND transporter periplasmic adaptor subunit n=1 Tax=Novosphingobium rosa TaxID=76978 RepID=UPI00082A7F81|nr:efflux RND transporter periplasmic adaptor subunit [Novosphingobium rosa]
MTLFSRNGLLVAGSLTALVAAGAWWHADSAPAATALSAPAPLDAVHPKKGDIAASFEADARIEPWQSADLFPKVSGYVTGVRADIGDHVRAGQVLAVIRLPEMTHELAEDRAQLDARRSELALQQITQKRQEDLYRARGLTDQAMDEVKAHTAIAHAQADLANATLAKAQAIAGYTRIVAPFDGVVTRRLVNDGTFVQAATNGLSSPLFTVQQTRTLRVFVAVPSAQAPLLRRGQSASMALGSTDKPVTGTIARTAESLDPVTRTMRAEIDVANTDRGLLPGSFTRAKIETARHAGVLGLPNAAIGSDTNGSFVLAAVQGKVVRRPIKTGLTDGTLTEIVEGVGGNDLILANAKAAPPAGTAIQTKVLP